MCSQSCQIFLQRATHILSSNVGDSRGMAVSSDATFLIVADTRSHVIKRIEMSTGETRLIAGSGSEGYEGYDKLPGETNEDFTGVYGTEAEFRQPSGVALTPDDKYAIVADTGKKRESAQFIFQVHARH